MGKKIAVIGDGSWATALIHIMSQSKEQQISWWVRKPESVKAIKAMKRNPNYVTSIAIDLDLVSPTSNLQEAISGAEVIFIVVPAAFVKDVLDQLSAKDFEGKVVVSAIKGMLPTEGCIVTDYIHNEFSVGSNQLAIVAGPCHAEEVALNRQSYLTIGCNDDKIGEQVAALLRCNFVSVNCENDLVGIEYAAIMKNIIALACGVAHGLNYGDNFQAVLVSNAMNEIRVFLDEFFPIEDRNVCGSAYLGDLLVTSYSQFSRNRTFGNMIGRGYTVKSTMIEMNMVAEGYYAVKSVYDLFNEKGAKLPICEAVYRVLYEKIAPAIEMHLLKEQLK